MKLKTYCVLLKPGPEYSFLATRTDELVGQGKVCIEPCFTDGKENSQVAFPMYCAQLEVELVFQEGLYRGGTVHARAITATTV